MQMLIDVIKDTKPALLIGNGINNYQSSSNSWEDLLATLAAARCVQLTVEEKREMSNTEYYDIIDLAKPNENEGKARENLQKTFCLSMKDWAPGAHHKRIVGWAKRHSAPIITVNFDENLSMAASLEFYRAKKHFTHYYPWSSYFSDRPIIDPKSSFAVWHAHGMMRYPWSIRLGLTHYMGAVSRARPQIVGKGGALAKAKGEVATWPGEDTWLEILFFSPLLIFGFSFKQDENFFRWLFLERARLHRLVPEAAAKTWYVATQSGTTAHRKPFFERLGMDFVTVPSYAEIYEAQFWNG